MHLSNVADISADVHRMLQQGRRGGAVHAGCFDIVKARQAAVREECNTLGCYGESIFMQLPYFRSVPLLDLLLQCNELHMSSIYDFDKTGLWATHARMYASLAYVPDPGVLSHVDGLPSFDALLHMP